jgi:tRNA threonylcarbamoyladenosine biosynthesis protein TsaB
VLIAAIETSTVSVSVALADGDGLVARFDAPRIRRHAETVIPALDAILKLTDRMRADVTHLCVDVGPGMFTGLRVGVTTAITVAYALGLSVIGVSSLELLAWRLALDNTHDGHIGAVLDGRRTECFAEAFAVTNGSVVSLGDAMVSSPDAVATYLRESGCTSIVGDGAVAYPDAFPGFAALAPLHPDAATAAVLATQRLDQAVAPDALALRYLRDPDAQIPKDLR